MCVCVRDTHTHTHLFHFWGKVDKNNALCVKTKGVEGSRSVVTKDSEVDNAGRSAYILLVCVFIIEIDLVFCEV